MIKYKARARKEDKTYGARKEGGYKRAPPLSPASFYVRRFTYPRRFTYCAQISQRLPLHSSNSVAISNRGVIPLYSLQIYEDSIKLQVSTAK